MAGSRPPCEPLKQALALDPSLGEAHYVIGLVQRDLDQLPAARKSLEEAARRSPASQTSAREALAEVYSLEGEHARAINQLEALAALDSSRPDRVVAVGLAQARAGREDAAVVTLGRAVERFPDAPQVYAALGHVWLTDRATPRRSRGAEQGARSAEAGREPIGCDQRDVCGAWPRVDTGRRCEGRRTRAAAGRGEAAGRRPRRTCSSPTSRRVMAASRWRVMRLLKYATLVGDERSLATVATRIARLLRDARRTGARGALVRSRHR